MLEQRILRELVALDSLFADFISLFDFDDTYTFGVCTNTHLYPIYSEIRVVLLVDISYDIFVDKVDIANVNVVHAAKILSSIEQPSLLEFKSLTSNLKYAFLEFEENLSINFFI